MNALDAKEIQRIKIKMFEHLYNENPNVSLVAAQVLVRMNEIGNQEMVNKQVGILEEYKKIIERAAKTEKEIEELKDKASKE